MGNIFIVIEGEPFLSRVKEYRQLRMSTERAWRDWALANNGTGRVFFLRHITSTEISREKGAPEGWIRVRNPKYYNFRPRKNSPAYKEMLELPKLPSYTMVFDEKEIPTNMSYSNPDGGRYGGGCIGNGFDPIQFGWIEDIFTASIPDVRGRVLAHRKEYPTDIIENDLDNWKLPEGLRQISDAEYKFMWAEHNLKIEQKKNADQE